MKQAKRFTAALLASVLAIGTIPAYAAEPDVLTRGEAAELLLSAAQDYNPGVQQSDILKGYSNGDLDLDGTTPLDPGISILGGSSDHLLLDVTDAETPLAVGDSVQFSLNYAATLRVMTSPYVKKIAETGN